MFKCKTGCKGECCGNVPIHKSVIKRNKKKLQRKYYSIMLDDELVYPVTKGGRCIFLNKEFQCEIYKDRPYICKVYGSIQELQCPYIDMEGKLRTDEVIAKMKKEIQSSISTNERYFMYRQKYFDKNYYKR